MNVQEGWLYWPYIASMVLLGILVGRAINLAANIFPTGRWQSAQATQCRHAHQRAIASIWPTLLAYPFHRVGCECCHSILLQGPRIVEFGTGFLFGLVSYHFNVSMATAVPLIYMSILVLISTIDMKNRLVPNTVLYPATVLVFLLFPISQMASDKWIWELYLVSIEGGVASFLILLFIYLASSGDVGAGDVKLGALIGAATGFPLVLGSLALAFVTGGVAALLLVVLKARGLKDQMPYAPYLAGAAVISLLLGENITEWYQALFKQ